VGDVSAFGSGEGPFDGFVSAMTDPKIDIVIKRAKSEERSAAA